MPLYLPFLFLLFSLEAQEALPSPSLETVYAQALDEPEAVMFTPPEGYFACDPLALPDNVSAMVIGSGNREYPPSINLGTEHYEGTLCSYLKLVQQINHTQNATWKDLGQIHTQSGNASLSQVDQMTPWGPVRLLHAIILRYHTAYILTCACLKDEFTLHYKHFFQAMRSLKINEDVFEMIKNPQRRSKLQSSITRIKHLFTKQLATSERVSDTFEENTRNELVESFAEEVQKEYADLGPTWKNSLLNKLRQELCRVPSTG